MKGKLSKRGKIAIISIASVIAFVGLGFGSFGLYIVDFNAHPSVTFDISYKTQTPDITAMNFNVRCLAFEDLGDKTWFNRAPLIITQIAQNDPDIICFQEVTHIHEGYLNKALKGYGKVTKYRQNGLLAESTPIYYNLNKFDLVDSGGFWLSKTPEKMSKDWGSRYRVCAYAILEQKSDKRRFVVFNTHLDDKSEEARIKGIELVISKIKEFGNMPAMLFGDMNDAYGSPTYIAAAEAFDDSREIASTTEPNRNTYHAYGKKETNSAIDYCFLSKDCFDVSLYHVIAEKVYGKYASDHYAVKVVLRLKNNVG